MNNNNIRSIVYLFFLLSGMTGLIFQITWFKYLSLFLGNTTYAQTIVLATFLGGLAIGNFFFGKIADRIKNELLFYGLIELLIGLYCLFFPFIINLFEKMFYFTISEELLLNNSIIYLLIKFLISILILILPTILMGGTLPLLTQFFTERVENIRKENANLYFLNSFGAVVGVFFAGFIFIKTFGLDITMRIGGIVNVLIGSISILISSFVLLQKATYNKVFQGEEIKNNITDLSPVAIKLVVLIAGLSGFASLMYEILWTRVLISVFGSSTYSFSLMLMAFISGITIGSFIVSSSFISKFNRINVLIFSQLMISITILIALLILPYLPYQFWKLSTLFAKSNEAFSIFLSFEFFICFTLMFIPTIFMGMSLPLIVEIIAHNKQLIGYSVGIVFSVNTFGNVLGSFATGLILIPFLGIKNSFLLGIIINLLAVLILLVSQKETIRKSYKKFIYPSYVITVLLLFIIPDWAPQIMTSGVFRKLNDSPPPSYSDYKKIFKNREIIFYKDGISGNVSVIKTLDTISQKILLINGKSDASSVGDLPTQLLLGHIPMILHPQPQNIFIIGYGSGSTVNAVLKHNPNEVICSEISKEVLEASKLFSEVNENCLNDKRVKVVVEDAQSFLKITNKKFDVIISEPSNPWIAGIGNLFSKEYFERCKDKLNSGGIMCQWFHIYEMDDDVLTLVISTFNSVFPYVQIWGGAYGDLILIGSLENIQPDFNVLSSKFSKFEVKENLKKIGIETPFTLLTTQILSPEGSFTLTTDNFINSERKPLLEFLAPIAFYKGNTSLLVYQNDEKFDTLNLNLLVKEYIKKFKVTDNEILNAIEYHLNRSKNYRLVYGFSKYLSIKYKSNIYAVINKYKTEEILGVIKYDKKELIEDYSIHNNSSQIAGFLANQILLENINATNFLKIFPIVEAEKILLSHHNSDKLSDLKFYTQLASVFLKNSQPDKAIEYCYKVEQILKDNPHLINHFDLSEFFYTFAASAFYTDNYQKVIEYFIQLANYNQNYQPKKFLSKKIEWKVKEAKRQTQKIKND